MEDVSEVDGRTNFGYQLNQMMPRTKKHFRGGNRGSTMGVMTSRQTNQPIGSGALAARYRSPIIALVLILASALPGALSGCGAVIGAGAATGVAAYQERGLEGKARDLKIELAVFEAWLHKDHTYSTKMSIEVYERRVLLTGVVEDPAVLAEAVRLVWTVQGVKEVLNEVQVTKGGDIVDYVRDAWITANLKTKLTFDENILAINYAIETVNAVVYVIGIAQDGKELDRVLAHARTIDYVRKVINHVRIKDKAPS